MRIRILWFFLASFGTIYTVSYLTRAEYYFILLCTVNCSDSTIPAKSQVETYRAQTQILLNKEPSLAEQFKHKKNKKQNRSYCKLSLAWIVC